ncbi:MAG TPA: tetratricopeptide repeat protein [Gemmatimonadales bacterium]|nr:tetratricopeptide repeat protein [Gemmatimonadales bacterium]
MSKLEKAKERARALEVKDAKGAVEAWIEVLKEQDSSGEPNPDLAIYNKVGDLWLKLKDPGQAADYYDRAVDKYAEQGLHNNAIAMCNKVLRNAPGRQNTYLKLAKLYAAKGFTSEAKQNFVEYAERVHKTGNIQLAFAALKEFTDISSEGEQLRHMLEEQLAAYGVNEVPQRRTTQSQKVVEPPKTPGVKRKTSSLVFLDLDAPAPGKGGAAPAAPAPPAPKPAATAPATPKAPAAPAPKAPAPPAPKVAAPPPKPAAKPAPRPAPPPPPEPEPVSVLDEAPVAEPDTSLQIETTSLADDGAGGDAGSLLEGLESTSADFGSVRDSATNLESVREEITADDVEPMAELEPTAEEEPPPPPARGAKGRQAVVELSFDEVAEPEVVVEAEPGVVAPVDDEPLLLDEGAGQETRDFIMTEDDTSVGGRPSVHIDVGLDGGIQLEDSAPSIDFSDIEEAPAVSIEDLEGRVADNPDDPEAHQALGEALIENGDRERGIEELDHATAGFESAGNRQQAEDLVDEILRLDPNSIRHRQKVVEFAFKSGEKDRLVTAYLELGDTLLRNDVPEKARAVYERVAEHDPKNARAQSALAMLAPAAPAAAEGKVKAKDAKMKVRDEAAEGADFVDLGSMILDDDHDEARDSRMKVQDEEPTGDEQQDFQEMLARFKQGIDENIEETDFQSHYDLGVAFKEMGLLDEAIAEFQKALRAHDGKLRTSEALGVCFFEKGAFGVAESILRRGLELPSSGDEERLGILYWLGRACEEQSRPAEAKDLYGKVFAVNIRFLDVGERVKALAKAR